MGSFPYQRHFDLISKEELSLGYPDITFMVRGTGASPQYPHQINFEEVRNNQPTDKQLKILRKGTDEIIKMYCPGTPNPY